MQTIKIDSGGGRLGERREQRREGKRAGVKQRQRDSEREKIRVDCQKVPTMNCLKR